MGVLRFFLLVGINDIRRQEGCAQSIFTDKRYSVGDIPTYCLKAEMAYKGFDIYIRRNAKKDRK